MISHPVLFEEKQRFRQWWLWLLLAGAAADIIWSVVGGVGSDKDDSWLPYLLLLIPAVLMLLIASCRLHTQITAEGIAVRFAPFHRHSRYYKWEDIYQVYVRRYSPLGEYGGWGLRGLGRNRALNISGNQGLQLVMKDGKKLLIGTKQPGAIRQVLQQIPRLHQQH